jgi:hypothetical protein
LYFSIASFSLVTNVAKSAGFPDAFGLFADESTDFPLNTADSLTGSTLAYTLILPNNPFTS